MVAALSFLNTVTPAFASDNTYTTGMGKVSQIGSTIQAQFSAMSQWTAPDPTQYNQQDRMYMEMIMAHHREAIAMADEELNRGTRQEVKDFAQKMKNAQMDSLAKAKDLYRKTFNAEPPETMTTSLLNQLKASASVDRTFLTLMISHHMQGAMMDRKELILGQKKEVKQFAQEDIQMQFGDLPEIYSLLFKTSQ